MLPFLRTASSNYSKIIIYSLHRFSALCTPPPPPTPISFGKKDLLPPPILLIGRFAFNLLDVEAPEDQSPAAALGPKHPPGTRTVDVLRSKTWPLRSLLHGQPQQLLGPGPGKGW